MTNNRLKNWQSLRKGAAAVLSALMAVPAGPLPLARAASPATIDAVEVAEDQIKISVTGEAQYNAFVTAKPPRLVVQLLNTEYQAGVKTLAGRGKYLMKVRAGQFQRSPSMVSRIVMDLSELAGYRVARNGDVLTVQIGGELPAEAPEAPKTQRPTSAPGEAGGMTTQTSSELAAMAAAADVTKTQGPAAKEAPVAAAADLPRAPRGDIMSRLPKDLVSLDFESTDIKDVLKLLASKARVNIIYGTDVSGTLSLHLVDVPFNEAFRTALAMMGLTTLQAGDSILRVLTPSVLAKSQTAAASMTKVISLNYSKADTMVGAVNSVRTAEGRAGTTIADAKTNSLIVTESPEGLAATERLIAQLDVRPKQVMIEAKLIEVNLNNELHYGIQWDYLSIDTGKLGHQQGTNLVGTTQNAFTTSEVKPLDRNTSAVTGIGAAGRGTGVSLPAGAAFGALTFGRITNNYFLSATLTAAAAQGKVKVLSDPKIATLNNQAANINVTTQTPYVTTTVTASASTTNVTYVTTGIQLSVTPTINADGRITLVISPTVSQPSTVAAVGGAPAINSRNAATTVLVKDGETIVIGGLISDSVSDQWAKIPILGDIPILGWLFKKKDHVRTRNELLIFVTPRILTD